MKTLKDYLIESKRQYSYRVKIAGEVPEEFFKRYEKDLSRFDVAKFTDPKRTPIHSILPGFTGVRNQEMHIVDIVLNYPAHGEQLRQMATDLGVDPDCINVMTSDFSDQEDKSCAEHQKLLSSETALLNQPYDADNAEQKAASNDYADGYKTAALNTGKVDYKFAGELPKKAETTNDLPMGKESPLSKINRPALPKTGYRN